MPLVRKRRAEPEPESDPEGSESENEHVHENENEPSTQRSRQRRRPNASDSSDDDEPDTYHPTSIDVMVKKMVRLALSSEYARQPIRRTEVSAKVLGEQGVRQFRTVFEAAQKALRERFGMEMTELPGRQKVTIHDRRAAQRVEKPSATNKSWIVTSTLPAAYRKPEILPPTKAPWEGTYTGLYSFVVAVILLNGGSLPEQKLDRYLKRTNADTYTPIDRTDRLIQRLCKDGYIVRLREMDGGEEVIEYMVGPRGKMEVGPQGVAGLVREVYGRQRAIDDAEPTALESEQMKEFELRLARSLGISRPEPREPNENDNAEPERRQTQRREEDDDSD